MNRKRWARAALTRYLSAGFTGWRAARALLPAGVVLLLVAGCSILPGGAGEGANTDSAGSSSSDQTSEDEANIPVVDAVKSSSDEISQVRVVPAIDGLAKFLNVSVTMTGEQVTAAQIDAMLAAAASVIPEENQRINFSVRRSDGRERLSIVEQAQELGVPEFYVHSDYTLAIPLEWLASKYGTAP